MNKMPVEAISDEEVLALARSRLSDEQMDALSDLLEQNRESKLDADGKRELDELMRIYERGLLRKSEALRVAVQRRLIEPLKS
ncbi:MAG: hypothetical protein AB1631_24355 [Acidobacteriota bacterium]